MVMGKSFPFYISLHDTTDKNEIQFIAISIPDKRLVKETDFNFVFLLFTNYLAR